MSHKNEAEEALEFVQDLDVSETYAHNTGEHKADQIAIAQLKATLALVEAQEAANELKRIEVLISLAESGRTTVNGARAALSAIFTGSPDEGAANMAIHPHIAAALGIGGDA